MTARSDEMTDDDDDAIIGLSDDDVASTVYCDKVYQLRPCSGNFSETEAP
jgi:hypothetical protein